MHDSVIVTHLNPDVDAIGSVWLLKRFDKENYKLAKVVFVPAGEKLSVVETTSLGVSESEVVHVDTGGGEFDHHDEEGVNTCAARKVHEYLIQKYPDLASDEALQKVVAFINGTDHFESYFWPEPNHDRYVFGIENILNGFKLGGHGDDSDLVALGLDCFDGAYTTFKILIEAQKEISKGVEFDSVFGKGIGIESSNDAVMKQAQKMGYAVVVRKDVELGNVRIKAAPLPEIDLTRVYKKITSIDKEGSWYFHPGKHMLLNGSRKNLGQKASPLSLKQVIEIVGGV